MAKPDQKGQSFLEVIIVLAISVLLISGLIVGTVTSLKTTNFASAKSQATKYAQEGIEIARRERDTSWYFFYNKRDQPYCVDKNGTYWAGITCTTAHMLDGTAPAMFSRIVQYTWNGNPGGGEAPRMEVTATVTWQEGTGNGTGTHQSTITTYFTQWR